MLTVADRAEPPRGLCPQPLTKQAGGNGFNVVLRQFVSETRCTITLFCLRECLTDSSITDELELLALAWLMVAQTPGIPTAAGNTEHTTHGVDAELCLVFFDEDILHFRRFAKYVTAWPFEAQRQTLFTVEAVYPFVIIAPALRPEHHVYPAISVVNSRFGDLTDSQAQCAVIGSN